MLIFITNIVKIKKTRTKINKLILSGSLITIKTYLLYQNKCFCFKSVFFIYIYLMDNYMEIMAYIGSVIILMSFIVKDVKWLRLLNNVGCLIFLVYAFYHGRTPLILLNSGVILVNIYHLIKKD